MKFKILTFVLQLLCAEPFAFSCDWWSFGVCFYHMLTGNRLFNENSTSKIADNILNEVRGKLYNFSHLRWTFQPFMHYLFRI